MTKFVVVRAETYTYLIYDTIEYRKSKSTKKFLINNLKFESSKKSYLEAIQLENKMNYLEKPKKST